MAWIRTVAEEAAEGDLRRVYDRIGAERGKLSDIMKVQSLLPRAMEAHLELYMSLLFSRPGLTREEREMIAVAVSAENDCRYCVEHHTAALASLWKNESRARRFSEDPEAVELSERVRAILDYAVLLTREPGAVGEQHVQRLREHGLAEEDILTANMITGYFNFVNRIAEGLGVEPSVEEVQGYRY